MSVRKRTWTTARDVEKTAWIVDYKDATGKRRLKTFAKKKNADIFATTAAVEIREGVHVAHSASVTVAEAGKLWLATSVDAGLERGTLVQYRQLLDLHIEPLIGAEKLSALTVPKVRAFKDRLADEGNSSSMVKKVLGALGSIIADAQERGLVVRNAVRDMRSRKRGEERRQEKRHKGKLKVGVSIPAREEIKAIVANLNSRWRPILITAIFTGLRASELRGLCWQDVNLDGLTIHVRQRADRFKEIGAPKSEAGDRTIPLSPIVVTTLREWKLQCPSGDLNLVFPNGSGNVEELSNIVQRGFIPAQKRAGVTGYNGAAKYTGIYSLRHFYASWCINRKEDGGQGLPPKVVQERLGHSSITLTMDTYSHLFPRGDDAEELAAAERALLA